MATLSTHGQASPTQSDSAGAAHAFTKRAVDAEVDRVQQKDLLAALNAWGRALRRDECGAWRIDGKRGSVHSWGDGKTWVLFVAARSRRHWAATKVRLSFCGVTQDGDEEGCLRLHQLPSPEQAAAIRDALGIRKKMEFTPDDLERRRASVTRLSPALRSAKASVPVPLPIRKQKPILEREPAFFIEPITPCS
jgi:hypothetical protein